MKKRNRWKWVSKLPRKKNPESVHDRHAALRAEAKRIVAGRRAGIEANIRKGPDRYQATHFLNNMIKAIDMVWWNNTLDDYVRQEEAKAILQIRRKRSRKGR